MPDRAPDRKTIREDLEWLADVWTTGDLDEPTLRRASPTLRKLLCDQQLVRAWNELGRERGVRKPFEVNTLTLPRVRDPGLLLLTVGGGRRRGLHVAGWAVGGEGTRLPPPIRETVKLNRFVEGACIYWKGQYVSRADLIAFVANQLGGAHYGDIVRGAEKALHAWLTDSQFPGISFADHSNRPGILGLHPLYFELLTVGQFLGRSPGAIEMLRVLGSKVVPEPLTDRDFPS